MMAFFFLPSSQPTSVLSHTRNIKLDFSSSPFKSHAYTDPKKTKSQTEPDQITQTHLLMLPQ